MQTLSEEEILTIFKEDLTLHIYCTTSGEICFNVQTYFLVRVHLYTQQTIFFTVKNNVKCHRSFEVILMLINIYL